MGELSVGEMSGHGRQAPEVLQMDIFLRTS